jgi:hypothetical protein
VTAAASAATVPGEVMATAQAGKVVDRQGGSGAAPSKAMAAMSWATTSAGSSSWWKAQVKGCSSPAGAGGAAIAARLRTTAAAGSLPRGIHGMASGGVPGRVGTTVWTALDPSTPMPSNVSWWACATVSSRPPIDWPMPSRTAGSTGG